MKKSLIIAMCCITVLFAACKKEKPYEKFLGNYNGSALVNGTVTIGSGSTTLNKDIEQTFPMTISLSAGEADNKLVLTYIPDEQQETFTATGTITNDKVVFDPIQVNQVIEGSAIDITLNLNGTLTGNIFAMNGTFNGDGNVSIAGQLIPIPFTTTGTVTANLNKLVNE